MADGLGISASYLNLVERDQRPLTAQLILKLAQTYDVNLRSLSDNDSTQVISDLREVFADPLLNENRMSAADLVDLATNTPATAHAVVTLYRAYRDLVERSAGMAERLAGGATRPADLTAPVEEVRDFSVANKNYFAELEDAAAALWESDLAKADDLTSGLRRHLRALGVTVRVMPTEFMERLLRRFDRHSSRLFLSEVLSPAAQRFQMAYQIALLEHSELLDLIAARGNAGNRDDIRKLLRTMLANYFAGAVLMPYDRFLQVAEKKRYDIRALCQRFEVSFEQACHRLTTLQKPGAQGIAFFFLRVDPAGNISKRLAAGGFHFARFGGACPRWNVHQAFRSPGRVLTQVVQMPDGAAYFSISRTVEGHLAGAHGQEIEFAIGLGCDVKDAHRTIYADGLDLKDARAVTPIGLNCRLCERADCSHRAFPPINRALVIDETMRTMSPYIFREPV